MANNWHDFLLLIAFFLRSPLSSSTYFCHCEFMTVNVAIYPFLSIFCHSRLRSGIQYFTFLPASRFPFYQRPASSFVSRIQRFFMRCMVINSNFLKGIFILVIRIYLYFCSIARLPSAQDIPSSRIWFTPSIVHSPFLIEFTTIN